MDNFDFHISHAVINTLHSAFQGRFAALSAAVNMGAQIDTAEHADIKTRLD